MGILEVLSQSIGSHSMGRQPSDTSVDGFGCYLGILPLAARARAAQQRVIMEQEVSRALARLVGLPLWSSGRAADLQWFAFGSERRAIPLRNGGSKVVSEYSLHVQCAWRIRRANRILVASGDLGYPAGDDPYADVADFAWDVQGSNQRDARITELFEEYGESALIVERVDTGKAGEFSLAMRGDVRLDVFPDNSIIHEYGRLFTPYSDTPHILYTDSGIEME